MRQWILRTDEVGLEALDLIDVPLPEPGPGQVRIRVHTVSLNRRDQMALDGSYGRIKGRNLVPVSDGAGTVDAVGPAVSRWKTRDRVAASYFDRWHDGPPHSNMGLGLGAGEEDGMLAEYVVLPEHRLLEIPDSIELSYAATMPCAALTGWNAVMGGHRPISDGDRLLVLGSGNVSLFATLFGLAAGAEVFATSGSDAKAKKMRALGVSLCLDYKKEVDWGTAIFTRTQGVDKVVEVGGAGTLNKSLAAVGPGGEVAMVGFLSGAGEAPDPYLLMGKQAMIRGVAVGSESQFHEMKEFMVAHAIVPIVDSSYLFEDAPDAYARQIAPDTFGKVLIRIG